MFDDIKPLLIDGIQDSELTAVLNRLESFGIDEPDEMICATAMNTEYLHIKTECRTEHIHENLLYVYADMCVGNYLMTMFRMNKLDLGGFDLSGAIKQIVEGDVSITFDENGSDANKFIVFADYLINGRKGELLRYRRLMW